MSSTLIRAAMLLVLFPAVQTKTMVTRSLLPISTVACKEPNCVEVLSSFYGRFFVEEGQFINFTSSLHLCRHFFLFVDAASLWRPEIVKASLPEVNQFTGNCFRMVRIVLKITFLGLRYPGQRPECPSLSYYGSCLRLLIFKMANNKVDLVRLEAKKSFTVDLLRSHWAN